MNNKEEYKKAAEFFNYATGQKEETPQKDDKQYNSAAEFFDYANDQYKENLPKSAFTEVPEQLLKKTAMSAIGGAGDIWQTMHQLQQESKSSPVIEGLSPGGPLINIPESKLPTSGQIGEKIGYAEPTTGAGRIAKRIGSAVGSTAPFVLGSLATGGGAALPLLGASAVGGLAGGVAEELGASEGVATGIDIASSLSTGALSAARKVLKSSGLTARGFENAKKSFKMSHGEYESLVGKVEDESKDLAKNLFSKNETYKELKETPVKFYQDLENGLDRVRIASEAMPMNVTGGDIQKSLENQINMRKKSPITLSEADKAYTGKMESISKELDPNKKHGLDEIVRQYRSNNKDLVKSFSTNQTGASLDGIKDALLDYNRALSSEIHRKVPGSELDKLFIKTNKRFADQANIGKIDEFIDSIFSKDKINYSKTKDYFSDKELRRKVRTTFGADTEKEFNQLIKDLISQEKGIGKIRKAEGGSKLSPLYWTRKLKSTLAISPQIGGGVSGVVKKSLPLVGVKSRQGISKDETETSIDKLLSR